MKNSYYFPHDYHARHDPKLERLRMEIGAVGDGIYWDIVEMLYEENGYLPIKNIPLIAKALNTSEKLINKVVKDSELFCINGVKFYSESLLCRLRHINAKRRKARSSAILSHSANAQRTHSERSAIKESKVKESKVKESKQEVTTEIGGLILKNSFLETIKTSYPNLNLDSEIRACITWHKTNNPRCKNWTSSINNWLKKSQEKIGVVGEAKPTITLRRPL